MTGTVVILPTATTGRVRQAVLGQLTRLADNLKLEALDSPPPTHDDLDVAE
jgi:hypothetical protein